MQTKDTPGNVYQDEAEHTSWSRRPVNIKAFYITVLFFHWHRHFFHVGKVSRVSPGWESDIAGGEDLLVLSSQPFRCFIVTKPALIPCTNTDASYCLSARSGINNTGGRWRVRKSPRKCTVKPCQCLRGISQDPTHQWCVSQDSWNSMPNTVLFTWWYANLCSSHSPMSLLSISSPPDFLFVSIFLFQSSEWKEEEQWKQIRGKRWVPPQSAIWSSQFCWLHKGTSPACNFHYVLENSHLFIHFSGKKM